MKNISKFNMLCVVHNHGLGRKLSIHPIVSHLDSYENKFLVEMTMNMIMPKKHTYNFEMKEVR